MQNITKNTYHLSRYDLDKTITTYAHDTLGDVRVLTIEGRMWVVLKEIKKILNIGYHSRLVAQVHESDTVKCVLGFGSAANLVSREGVELILSLSQSKKSAPLSSWLLPLLDEYEKGIKGEAKEAQKAPEIQETYEVKEAEIITEETPTTTQDGLKLFSHETFGAVRVIDKEGEPWFVAKDVCGVLGLKDTSMAISALDDDEVSTSKVGTNKGKRQVSLINESGLYSLIFRSNKPQAKAFSKWVRSEVLPSIRKTGGYIQTAPTDTPEVIMAKALHIADATIKDMQVALSQAHTKIEQDAPKVAFAEQVEGSEDSIPVGTLAKLLKQNGMDIGRDRLFKKLADDGFLIKEGKERLLPTQRSMNAGYMEIQESTFRDPATLFIHLKKRTLITGKGQRYFLRRYIG